MSLDHSYRLASHLKNFPKGLPGGVWNLSMSNSHISLNSLYQMSVHSNQTNKTTVKRGSRKQERQHREVLGLAPEESEVGSILERTGKLILLICQKLMDILAYKFGGYFYSMD